MTLPAKEIGINFGFIKPVVERLFLDALNHRVKAVTERDNRLSEPAGNGDSLPTLLRSCIGLHVRSIEKKDTINHLAPRFRMNWDTYWDNLDLEIYYWDDQDCIRELCRIRWSDLMHGADMAVHCYDHIGKYYGDPKMFELEITARIRAGLRDFWEIATKAAFLLERHSRQ